jgi:hypothetical protein
MKKILILISAFALSSCVSYDNYYKLDAEYLTRRQLETRRFETKDEDAMLIASAQVLQDLGFTISESETKLGLITASKSREMGSTAGKIALVTLAAFGGGRAVYDTEQKIYVTLVSSKSRGAKGFNVRVEFARMIWNNQGETRIERIRDRNIYSDFFDRLGQSLFLTANDI